VRYASNVEKELDQTEFVTWHVKNHLSVVQTILDYENRSGEAVKELNLLADKAGFRLLSLAEYESGLSDPFKHPETMMMGEIMERTTSTSNLLSHQSARLKTVLAFSFGIVFLGLILALVVFIPHPTPVQYHFFTVTIALAAGGLAAVMAGMIDVRLSFGKSLTIGAAGTLGVLVVVYFFLPAMVSNP
jgi:hypothetical protein